MSADKKRVIFWSGFFHLYLGGVEILGRHFLPRMRAPGAVSRTLIRIPELADRTVRIYNGLPAPKNKPDPLDFTIPTMLRIGRLVKEKGFDNAIQAIPILYQ